MDIESKLVVPYEAMPLIHFNRSDTEHGSEC